MKLIIIYFVIAIFAHTTNSYFFDVDGMKYFVSCPAKRNWYMALKFCLENGMYLVDVPTVQEEVRLLSLVLRTGQ